MSSRWLERLVGGWEESTIFTAATGTYSTVLDGVDNSRTGVTDRPNVVGDPRVSNPTLAKWFNTAAFVNAPIGSLGNAGRSIILGPGSWNVDMAFSRFFPVTERQKLDFRAEAFNVMNHARFGSPNTTLSSQQTFGQILSAGDPRILQFALKYIF